MPVAANAVFMIAAAVAFNRLFAWRHYPASLQEPAAETPDGLTHEEIVRAIRSIDSFVDITEEDLRRLVDALAEERRGRALPGPKAA